MYPVIHLLRLPNSDICAQRKFVQALASVTVWKKSYPCASLSTIPYRHMEEVEFSMMCSLTLEFDGGEWSTSCLYHSIPEETASYIKWIEVGWVTEPVWVLCRWDNLLPQLGIEPWFLLIKNGRRWKFLFKLSNYSPFSSSQALHVHRWTDRFHKDNRYIFATVLCKWGKN
jgi:hypothetical protein